MPFTGAVKLRALLLKAGPADQTPAKVALVRHRDSLLRTSSTLTFTALGQFPNFDHVDFSDIADMKPVQEFTVPQGRDVGEYHVMCVSPPFCMKSMYAGLIALLSFFRPAKFPNVTSITLFFPASQGADTTRIYYVGFLGQWSEVSDPFEHSLEPCPQMIGSQRKFEPVTAVYESKPNLADHDKIQGLNENWSAPSS